MDVDAFTERVRGLVEECRESLVRIEAAAQVEDRPELHAVSRAYAQLLMVAREYLFGAEMRRPQPRRLAARIDALRPAFEAQDRLVGELRLTPTPEDLAGLLSLVATLRGVP